MKYSDDCKVYRIRYYNVWFYLFAKTEMDEYKINILGERIGMGDSMMMKDIHCWCTRQNIRYYGLRQKEEAPHQCGVFSFPRNQGRKQGFPWLERRILETEEICVFYSLNLTVFDTLHPGLCGRGREPGWRWRKYGTGDHPEFLVTGK